MNILAFDTCFDRCSAALGMDLDTPAARFFLRSEPMKTGHAERLIPMIQELLIEASLSVEQIHKIAVTCGPGSFTGVRISIATARAFHLARQIPIVPFTSLEAIALHHSIRDACRYKDIVVAVDANRDEAYVQVFDGGTLEPFDIPRIVREEDFAFLPNGRPVYVMGTAAPKVLEALQKVSFPAQVHQDIIWPSMYDVILKSLARPISKKNLEPIYIRPPDAKPQESPTQLVI